MIEETPQIVKADVEQPSVEQQSSDQPTQQPDVEQQSSDQPTQQSNVEQQPSVEQPSVQEQPSTEQPTEQPSTEQPKEQPSSDEEVKSHLFAIRTTGGQEKVVLNLLQNRVRTQNINIQSVLLVDNLKGYVVLEAIDVNQAFNAIQGVRHIRGQLRGELEFKDIEGYLVKKSTVTELAVDKVVEIIGGPFKGMKATITRIDHDKEEATVILLDAPYQLPVTVDANYLKISTE